MAGLGMPIRLLAHEHAPDPALWLPLATVQKREELIKVMIVKLTVIYRFFEPFRGSLAHTRMYVLLLRFSWLHRRGHRNQIATL